MSITYRVGDTREVIATIPDGSVSLVACSPPFVALRSYLPADHPLKHAEIGSEPDPATFLDTMLALTAEWGRVLAPWGSIAIELGDTYSGSGDGGGDYLPGGIREGQQQFGARAELREVHAIDCDLDEDCSCEWQEQFAAQMRASNAAHWRQKAQARDRWPRPKSLALVPHLYAIALAYGINPLTGAPSPAGQWLVRNVIVWHRPNPAVGALGDKYRPSTSYITVATKSPKRWFDLTAVRTAPTIDPAKMWPGSPSHGDARSLAGLSPFGTGSGGNPAGAPPLDAWFDHHDTWTITTQPSRLAHYAMWPPKLAERLILSMCPLEVCSMCGEPRRRVEGAPEYRSTNGGRVVNQWAGERRGETVNQWEVAGGNPGHVRVTNTLGWTDCGHGAFTPGTVLDPFAGTGTTLAVADLHGRDAIGIDIDERNRDLLPARLDECRKALFGTPPEMPGQLSLLGKNA